MRFHFQFIDPKLTRNLRRHVAQCLLATMALFAVLSVEDSIDKAVVIAAIGSTAFVLFIMPHSETASPRHTIGGHFIALMVGAIVAIFDTNSTFFLALMGALAVGVSLFLMAATNTEHTPAAGTALQ